MKKALIILSVILPCLNLFSQNQGAKTIRATYNGTSMESRDDERTYVTVIFKKQDGGIISFEERDAAFFSQTDKRNDKELLFADVGDGTKGQNITMQSNVGKSFSITYTGDSYPLVIVSAKLSENPYANYGNPKGDVNMERVLEERKAFAKKEAERQAKEKEERKAKLDKEGQERVAKENKANEEKEKTQLITIPLNKSDWAGKELKAKVKSLKETTYQTVEKFGKTEKGETKFSYKYVYNEQGNEIQVISYSDGMYHGKLIEIDNRTYKYLYDNKGNKIERNAYDERESNKPLIQKNIYKYDDRGNRIEEVSYGQTGNNLWKYSFIYNNDGTYSGAYKYDERGDRIEQPTNDLRKYDAQGNTIEIDYFNEYSRPLTTPIIFKYEYDKNSNWTKKTEWHSGNGITRCVEITEREIEYY